MLVYFVVLAVMGGIHIVARPDILYALNPMYAVRFAANDGTLAFLALSVIPHLKITDRGLVDVDRFELVPLAVSDTVSDTG